MKTRTEIAIFYRDNIKSERERNLPYNDTLGYLEEVAKVLKPQWEREDKVFTEILNFYAGTDATAYDIASRELKDIEPALKIIGEVV